MEPLIFAISENGVYSGSSPIPEGYVEVSEQVFNMVSEMLDYLIIKINDGEVRVEFDVEKCRRLAKAKVKVRDYVEVDGVRILYAELPLIARMVPGLGPVPLSNGMFNGDPDIVVKAFTDQNLNYLNTIKAIDAAATVKELDAIVEAYNEQKSHQSEP